MSTQKFRAKKQNLYWKDHPNHKGPFFWFETEDGRKFTFVDFRVNECLDVKVFLCKKLNVVRSEAYAYELYEVPRKNLVYDRFPNHWKYGRHAFTVYEVKK